MGGDPSGSGAPVAPPTDQHDGHTIDEPLYPITTATTAVALTPTRSQTVVDLDLLHASAQSLCSAGPHLLGDAIQALCQEQNQEQKQKEDADRCRRRRCRKGSAQKQQQQQHRHSDDDNDDHHHHNDDHNDDHDDQVPPIIQGLRWLHSRPDLPIVNPAFWGENFPTYLTHAIHFASASASASTSASASASASAAHSSAPSTSPPSSAHRPNHHHPEIPGRIDQQKTGCWIAPPSFEPAQLDLLESQPIALDRDAFDEADRRDWDWEAASADMYADASNVEDALGRESEMMHAPEPHHQAHYHQNPHDDGDDRDYNDNDGIDHHRPATSQSLDTIQEAQAAFDNFDGIHCVDYSIGALPTTPELRPPSPEQHELEPIFQRSSMYPPEQLTSYHDPVTGHQMIYYPARLPDRLNLPHRLKKPKAPSRQSAAAAAAAIADRASAWFPAAMAAPSSPFMPFGAYTPTASAQTSPNLSAPGPNDEPSATLPMSDADKRKSRLSKLPPQPRASAFFNAPVIETKLQPKDGSAMATLDNLLDAGASAPVNAFTDHPFAPKHGPEPKPRKVRKKRPDSQPGPFDYAVTKAAAAAASTSAPDDANKRKSLFSLLNLSSSKDKKHGASRDSSVDREHSQRPPTATLGVSRDYDAGDDNDDDGDDWDDDQDADDEPPQGAPTTLIDELAMRKRQQKQRTQGVFQSHPNGLHSTLLELDAVAETQRHRRKSKYVKLAWEDPFTEGAAVPDDDSDDDADVPLGLIAASGGGSNGAATAAAMADVHRPLGLMEQRELEENETLGARRARLQNPAQHHYPRQSMMMTATGMGMGMGMGAARGHRTTLSLPRSLGPVPLHSAQPNHVPDPTVEPEIEDETLAERQKRLAAKENGPLGLPRARPVSGDFSTELLGQFGGHEPQDAHTADPSGPVPPSSADTAADSPDSETLAQRRARLQAQSSQPGPTGAHHMPPQQAHPATLAALQGTEDPTTPGLSGSFPTPSHPSPYGYGYGYGSAPAQDSGPNPQRNSMANLLAAYPRQDNYVADQRRRQQEDAMRISINEERMRLARAQMPAASSQTQHNLFHHAPQHAQYGAPKGGFMGGIYNDGSGGGRWSGLSPSTAQLSLGAGANSAHASAGQLNNRVERWRQDVWP